MAVLNPVRRSSLSEIVLQQLLERMRDGTLRPGERLPTEPELAAQLHVGRSSLREALRVLVVMGLVEVYPGRGAYVLRRPEGLLPQMRSTAAVAAHLERTALQDLFEVRAAVEGRAAELAAERAGSEHIEDIEKKAAGVERKIRSNQSYYRENAAFHVAIAKASCNYIIAETVAQLQKHHRSFRERLMQEEALMRERDIEEHRAIVDAIRMKDGPLARDLAIAHIRSSADTACKFQLDRSVVPLPRRKAPPGERPAKPTPTRASHSKQGP